jgi:hypothetical protein
MEGGKTYSPLQFPSNCNAPNDFLPPPASTEEIYYKVVDRILLPGPGDVLFAGSNDNMMQIGAMGGYFGHAMLVTASAYRIRQDSLELRELRQTWPCDVTDMWAVPFMECTRGHTGLHEATLLLEVDRKAGSIKAIAERSSVGGEVVVALCEGEQVEIFQSPVALSRLINSCQHRADLLAEVFAEMRMDMCSLDWSKVTAVKAALMPASLDRNREAAQSLAQLRLSWSTQPICTSVIVVFWQRYLCKLAPYIGDGSSPDATRSVLDLIHRWMPLKADRSLPGDVLNVLRCTGWVKCLRLNRLVSL